MAQALLDFLSLNRKEQIQRLYSQGSFVVAIRYYGYKINLFLLDGFYIEVFYNHKLDCIEKIDRLDFNHSRMKFYEDQISIKSIAS